MGRPPQQARRIDRALADFLARPCDVPGWESELLRLLAVALRADAIALLHTDPDTFLVLDGHVQGFPEAATAFFFDHVYLQRERVSFLDLRAEGATTSVLSDYTRGCPEREPRYVEVYRPHHLAHEARACLVSGRGYWGGLCICRGTDVRDFDRADRWLLERLAPRLGAALRRWRVLRREQGATGRVHTAAVVVVDRRGRVLTSTPGAGDLLEDLFRVATVGRTAGPLPLALGALRAALASRTASGGTPEPMELTVEGRSGRWWTASFLPLGGGERGADGGPASGDPALHGRGGEVAIVLNPAQPAQLLRGVACTYDLTHREEQVLELLARGLTTAEIAARLWLVPYTVQDHLKAIFAKVGVRSRRELMARVFQLGSPLGAAARAPRGGQGSAG